MNLRLNPDQKRALTFADVCVCLGIIVLAIVFLVPAISRPRHRHYSWCTTNLKQDMLAIKIWAGDNNDKYPMQTSVTNGGTMELMNSSEAWRAFQVMSNELSTPKVLVCEEDKTHTYGTSFDDSLKHHISYFVGVNATDVAPQSIVFGDSNFEFHKTTVPPGFFNMVSNNPPQWSSTRHPGSGNVALADGSVQSLTDKSLIQTLTITSLATNRIFIP